MSVSHRLSGDMNKRPDEGMEELPKRIIVLSVEGSVTEKKYFEYIEKYREQIGIKSVIHILILSRNDSCSDPQSVFNLLNEYIEIRKNGTEINIEYLKFLSDYKSSDNNDIFGIVIDRDMYSHSENLLKQLFIKCEENNCLCFLTNPCFEFWLLLHVSDVYNEYKDKLNDIKENIRVSSEHTFVSKELTKKTHHKKSISENQFKDNYLKNIQSALKHSEYFEDDNINLLNSIGSSLPKLFKILYE